MTTLIDTSAWIEFFRSKGDPAVKSHVADLLTLGDAAYTCPVRFELFHGARPNELADLSEGLGFARRLPLVSHHWDTAATHAAALRKKGQAVPATDLLIATLAAEEKTPVYTLDKHFEIIQKHALPHLELS